MSKDTLRTVIAFAVVIVILLGWQLLFRPKPRPRIAAPTAAPETTHSVPAPDTTLPAIAPPPAPLLVSDSTGPDTTLILENDFLRLEFSSRGAALRSALLKKYSAELVPSGAELFGVAPIVGSDTFDLSRIPFQAAASESSVTFSVVAESLGVTKTFTLTDGYTLRLSTALTGATGLRLLADSGLAVTEKDKREDISHSHLFARDQSKTHRLAVKQARNSPALTDVRWAGLKTKYFFSAVVFPDSNAVITPRALADNRVGFACTVAGPSSDLTLYIGPLEYTRLRSYHLGFEEAVSLGWAKPIALAILWLIKLLHRLLGNWGLAIIVFSILMKAAFYPLTRTQSRQMRQMQLLQPKLNELKVKHKDNPQALNQETMQLYKLYKINPLSGCLPMLVQLPVFWALYSVLRNFIDLRNAGFVLWLKDLSQPDTLFGHLPFFGNPAIGLLPILMGVSFIFQNLLTATDKKNWAMTIIFPIFITAMFLNFPSGLQLYWFTYNILSIVESLIATRGGPKWNRKPTGKPQPVTSPN